MNTQPTTLNNSTARTGKIARLPHAIREELNQRLHNGEPAKSILAWVNALPEVQEIMRLQFEAHPISGCNLTEWKNGGYRDWCLRQDVLGIVESLADQETLGDQSLTDGFNDKIAQWTSIHLASAARALLANETDPKNKLALLHQISADIGRLRRGDLQADRLDIERLWLELETEKARQKTDDEFWAWTKRPDIAKKLNPNKPKGISGQRLREIEDVLCLNESNFDHQLIGRLMRQRRLTHEAAAILLAEKAAELDAAERANNPKGTPGPDGTIADEGDWPDPVEARFEALCAEHGLVLDPEPPPPASPERSEVPIHRDSSGLAEPSPFEPGAECSLAEAPPHSDSTNRDSCPSNQEISFSAPEQIEDQASGIHNPTPECDPSTGSDQPDSASVPIQDRASSIQNPALHSLGGGEFEIRNSKFENQEAETARETPENDSTVQPFNELTIEEFCPKCHSPLPPVSDSNERPFPHCQSCGRPVPAPGEALHQLPESAPPYKPQEHCPSCDALLPPLRSDDSRPNGWCAHCTTSLPHPHSLIEHCPHCGSRIPASDPGSGRRATICFQCARPLPPPLQTSSPPKAF